MYQSLVVSGKLRSVNTTLHDSLTFPVDTQYQLTYKGLQTNGPKFRVEVVSGRSYVSRRDSESEEEISLHTGIPDGVSYPLIYFLLYILRTRLPDRVFFTNDL